MSPLIRLKALLLISQDYLHLPYPHNPTGTHTDIVRDPDPIDSRHSPILCKGQWDSQNIFVSPGWWNRISRSSHPRESCISRPLVSWSPNIRNYWNRFRSFPLCFLNLFFQHSTPPRNLYFVRCYVEKGHECGGQKRLQLIRSGKKMGGWGTKRHQDDRDYINAVCHNFAIMIKSRE